jgi:hypothetical protein
MTELQAKGLEAVGRLKELAHELFPLNAANYMAWVKLTAWRYRNARLAFAFVQAQVARLERQKLNGGVVA